MDLILNTHLEGAVLSPEHLLAMLDDAQMTVHDVVSVTTYVVVDHMAALPSVMQARDRALDGHRAASTLVTVPALARPEVQDELCLVVRGQGDEELLGVLARHHAQTVAAFVEIEQGIDMVAIFVQTCREAHRVRKVDPHGSYRQPCRRAPQHSGKSGGMDRVEKTHSCRVCGFRIKTEK